MTTKTRAAQVAARLIAAATREQLREAARDRTKRVNEHARLLEDVGLPREGLLTKRRPPKLAKQSPHRPRSNAHAVTLDALGLPEGTPVVLDVPRRRPAPAKPTYGRRADEHFAIARLRVLTPKVPAALAARIMRDEHHPEPEGGWTVESVRKLMAEHGQADRLGAPRLVFVDAPPRFREGSSSEWFLR